MKALKSTGLLSSALLCLVIGGIVASSTQPTAAGPWWILGGGLLTLSCALSASYSHLTFSLAVVTGMVAALHYPQAFVRWGDFELKRLITPLIQIIMFGMGALTTPQDFARVLQMPRAVFIGFGLQFTIMPLLAYLLVQLFQLPAEVSAGVILVGACPGGVASNVVTYLARGNVPLSVTMTACSTIASPLVTPLVMSQLAGEYITVPWNEMVWSILQMVIVPLVAGLIADQFLKWRGWRGIWVERTLSWLAMAAICWIIAIITAMSREALLNVGLTLVIVVALHNSGGYLLGYWGARWLGLNEADSRTVAIEVGLQNSGMASAIAVNVLQSAAAGLAPAIFGPWMNVSGSLLASWWRGRRSYSERTNSDTLRPLGPIDSERTDRLGKP